MNFVWGKIKVSKIIRRFAPKLCESTSSFHKKCIHFAKFSQIFTFKNDFVILLTQFPPPLIMCSICTLLWKSWRGLDIWAKFQGPRGGFTLGEGLDTWGDLIALTEVNLTESESDSLRGDTAFLFGASPMIRPPPPSPGGGEWRNHPRLLYLFHQPLMFLKPDNAKQIQPSKTLVLWELFRNCAAKPFSVCL